MRPHQPPTLVYRGLTRTITPDLIVRIVRDGLTPFDYQTLDLIRDYYGFATIGELITDAIARAEGDAR